MSRVVLRMLRILCILLCLTQTGCFRIRYRVGAASVGAQRYKNVYWQQYFALGLIPVVYENDYADFCHSDTLLEIRSYQTPANVLATILGGGLTAGRTLQVECATGGTLMQKNINPLTSSQPPQQPNQNNLPWWRRGF